MQLLKHIAEHHYVEDGETKEANAEGDPEDDAILAGLEGIEEKEGSSFSFKESMLDEFLWEKNNVR